MSRLEDQKEEEGLMDLQDTVGAVAFCEADGVAAGVSRSVIHKAQMIILFDGFGESNSGGLLLKYSGRVGEAAVYGAGCWAESSRDCRQGVACSVSGKGTSG